MPSWQWKGAFQWFLILLQNCIFRITLPLLIVQILQHTALLGLHSGLLCSVARAGSAPFYSGFDNGIFGSNHSIVDSWWSKRKLSLKLAHNLESSANVDFIKRFFCFASTRLKAIQNLLRDSKDSNLYLISMSMMTIGYFTTEASCNLKSRYHLSESTLNRSELTSWENLWIIKCILTPIVDLFF